MCYKQAFLRVQNYLLLSKLRVINAGALARVRRLFITSKCTGVPTGFHVRFALKTNIFLYS